MPDTRTHRGPHPEDARLFAADALPRLVAAVADLCWLLSREYATKAALKLVGDRYGLQRRQRLAVMRSACSDAALARRRSREVPRTALTGRVLLIDGFNVLTTIEAALAGGVILHARDGAFRDMASMHGTYRRVEETSPAIQFVGRYLEDCPPAQCRWYLDRPVSNSGRLRALLLEAAEEHGWNWTVELVDNPDRLLIEQPQIVATSDSDVLDRSGRWLNLARCVVAEFAPAANVLDMSI